MGTMWDAGRVFFVVTQKVSIQTFFFAKSSFLRRQIRTKKLSPKIKNDSKVSTKEIQPKVVQETFLAKGNIFHGQFDSIKKFYSLVRQKKTRWFPCSAYTKENHIFDNVYCRIKRKGAFSF